MWQSSMESLKRAPPLTEGTHCLHAAEIEEPLMFHISPLVHSLSLLFIYLLRFFLFFSLIYFLHLCVSVATTDQTDGR